MTEGRPELFDYRHFIVLAVDEFVPKRMAGKSSEMNGLNMPVPNRSSV
jgi:hypothetical protein